MLILKRYTPETDSWSNVAGNDVITPRINHSTVWTGSEMIVWGGQSGSANYLNDLWRYNPSSNTWTKVSQAGIPTERYHPTAV